MYLRFRKSKQCSSHQLKRRISVSAGPNPSKQCPFKSFLNDKMFPVVEATEKLFYSNILFLIEWHQATVVSFLLVIASDVQPGPQFFNPPSLSALQWRKTLDDNYDPCNIFFNPSVSLLRGCYFTIRLVPASSYSFKSAKSSWYQWMGLHLL